MRVYAKECDFSFLLDNNIYKSPLPQLASLLEKNLELLHNSQNLFHKPHKKMFNRSTLLLLIFAIFLLLTPTLAATYPYPKKISKRDTLDDKKTGYEVVQNQILKRQARGCDYNLQKCNNFCLERKNQQQSLEDCKAICKSEDISCRKALSAAAEAASTKKAKAFGKFSSTKSARMKTKSTKAAKKTNEPMIGRYK